MCNHLDAVRMLATASAGGGGAIFLLAALVTGCVLLAGVPIRWLWKLSGRKPLFREGLQGGGTGENGKAPWFWAGGIYRCVLAPMLVAFPRPSQSRQDLARSRLNVAQVGLALLEFETEYGKYPGPDTIAEVKGSTGTRLRLGTATSNQ